MTAVLLLALTLVIPACAAGDPASPESGDVYEHPAADTYEFPAELVAAGQTSVTTTAAPLLSEEPTEVTPPPPRVAVEALAAGGRPLPLPSSDLLPGQYPIEPSVVTAGGARYLLRDVSVSVSYDSETGLVVEPAGWWVINYPLDRIVGAEGRSTDELATTLLRRPAADLTNYYFYTEPVGREVAPEPSAPDGPAPISVTAGPDLVVNNRDPEASDDNDGSFAHPLRTISAAVDRAEAGSVIHVYSGVYRESVVIDADGTADAPIRIEGIRGAAGAMPVITGNNPFPADAWSPVDGLSGVYETAAFTNLSNSFSADGEELVERAAPWELISGEYAVTNGSAAYSEPRFDGAVNAREGSVHTFGSSQYIWQAKQTDGGGFVDLGSEFGDDFGGGVYWGSAWVYIDRPAEAMEYQWYGSYDFDVQVSGPFRAGGVSGLELSKQPYEYRVWLDGELLDGNVFVRDDNTEAEKAHPELGRGEFGETWHGVVMRDGWHHLVFQWDTTSAADTDRQSPVFRFGIPEVAGTAVTSAAEPSNKIRATAGTPQNYVSEYLVLGPVPAEDDPTVYVRLPDGADPNNADLDLAARPGPVVSILGDFVELRGFEVRGGSQAEGESLVTAGVRRDDDTESVFVQGAVIEGNMVIGSDYWGIGASVSGDQGVAPIVIRNNWVTDAGAVGIAAQGTSDRLTADTVDDWAPGRTPVMVEFNTISNAGARGYSRIDDVSGILFERMTGSTIRYNTIVGGGPGITLRAENYGIRVDGNSITDPWGWGIGSEANPGPNLIANNIVTGLRPGPEWMKAHLLTWDSDQTWIINNTTDGEWNTDTGWYGDVGGWGAAGPENFDRLAYGTWTLTVFRRTYINNLFLGSFLGGVEDYEGNWGERDTFDSNYREVLSPDPFDFLEDGADKADVASAFLDRDGGDYRLKSSSGLNSSGAVNRTSEMAALDFYGLHRYFDDGASVGAYRATPQIDDGLSVIEVLTTDGVFIRIEG